MTNIPADKDLVLPFETANIPKEYLDYYKTKRQNFFSSIQMFPELWKMFMILDAIWKRELEDLHAGISADRMFPMVLYINAHAKIRISVELAFSCCVSEARSVLRDAVEFTAHAHAMLKDPKLIKVWLCRDDGRPQSEAYKDAFERNKKTVLFAGLFELHSQWSELSDTGSHANMNALYERFTITETPTQVEFSLNYTGGHKPELLVPLIFSMLLTCFMMEELMYKDYESRLKLDIELMRMRAEFEKYKEWLRWEIIKRYNLQPPTAKP